MVASLRLWACGVAASIGYAGYVEDAVEGDDVFAPCSVASFDGFVAVWAQF